MLKGLTLQGHVPNFAGLFEPLLNLTEPQIGKKKRQNKRRCGYRQDPKIYLFRKGLYFNNNLHLTP